MNNVVPRLFLGSGVLRLFLASGCLWVLVLELGAVKVYCWGSCVSLVAIVWEVLELMGESAFSGMIDPCLQVLEEGMVVGS